jgi:hypothetical protein
MKEKQRLRSMVRLSLVKTDYEASSKTIDQISTHILTAWDSTRTRFMGSVTSKSDT